MCVSAEPRLHAALVSAAKVMRCIQCSAVNGLWESRIMIDRRVVAGARCGVGQAGMLFTLYKGGQCVGGRAYKHVISRCFVVCLRVTFTLRVRLPLNAAVDPPRSVFPLSCSIRCPGRVLTLIAWAFADVVGPTMWNPPPPRHLLHTACSLVRHLAVTSSKEFFSFQEYISEQRTFGDDAL